MRLVAATTTNSAGTARAAAARGDQATTKSCDAGEGWGLGCKNVGVHVNHALSACPHRGVGKGRKGASRLPPCPLPPPSATARGTKKVRGPEPRTGGASPKGMSLALKVGRREERRCQKCASIARGRRSHCTRSFASRASLPPSSCPVRAPAKQRSV